jgi:PAS domain S-box-containing protein
MCPSAGRGTSHPAGMHALAAGLDAATPPPARPDIRRPLVAAVAIAAADYLGARLGLALTLAPRPVSPLWPPNAILLAGLLLTPRRTWWVTLLVTLLAHLAVEVGSGVPMPMVLCWFVSNAAEALIGAEIVRIAVDGELRFDSFRSASAFVIGAGVVAALLTSFLDAGFVALNHWGGSSYWDVWRVRFLSNALANVTIVPAIVSAFRGGLASLRTASRERLTEAALIAGAILFVCFGVFAVRDVGPATATNLLYVPLPLILWAAIRFGPGGTSAAILAVAFASTWSAVHEVGPFGTRPPGDDGIALQMFLLVTGVPLLLLATVIEERSRAEDAIRQTGERLQLTLDAADMSTFDVDIRRGTITWGRRARRILGLTSEAGTIPIERFYDLVHPEDRAAVTRAFDHAIETRARMRAEFRVPHDDDSVQWVLARGSVARGSAGRPERMLGLLANVTARKHAELALRESEQRMALAASAAQLGFWSMDVRTRKAWRSEGLVGMFGLRPEDADREGTFFDLIHFKDRERVMAAYEATVQTAVPYDVEFRIVRPDGAVRWVHGIARMQPGVAGGSDRVVGVAVDTTDRRQAELEVRDQQRQMAHLARVAVVGELSGAIAHELNQPLTAILTNAQVATRLLQRPRLDVEELRAILRDIVEDDRRASAVIQKIRGLLRNDISAPEPLHVVDLASDVLSIMHGELVERGIACRLEIDPSLPPVMGDRVQLQQVLLNLVVNACDAMVAVAPSRRRLSIQATLEPNGDTRLTVADSGPGIGVSPVERIFEPFVSSKVGGLGLGLTICRTIVAAHGGRLWGENGPDGGATLHLLLPNSGNGSG